MTERNGRQPVPTVRHLTDIELEALLGSSGDPALPTAAEHARFCLICTRRLDQRRAEQAAIAAPHIAGGPMSHYVGAYLRHGAAAAATVRPDVEAHLQHCGVCRSTVAMMLGGPAPVEMKATRPSKPRGIPSSLAARLWRLLVPPAAAGAMRPVFGAGATLDAGNTTANADERWAAEVKLSGSDWTLRVLGGPRGIGYAVELKLTDEGGNPVTGVGGRVSLAGEDSPRAFVTNDRGVALLHNVPPGAIATASIRLGDHDG